MNAIPIENLKKLLLDNKLENDSDLLLYVQYASRLASLGETSYFNRLSEIFAQDRFTGRINEIFIKRCRQGLWDLEEFEGEQLGQAIIDAQDFSIFYRRGQEYIQKYIDEENFHWFTSWEEEASLALLDDEGADVLCQYLEDFPIADDDQLDIITAPITTSQYALLETLYPLPKPEVIHGLWTKDSPQTQKALVYPQLATNESPLLLSCDDDKPSEMLIDHQDLLMCKIEEFNINRSLNENWQLVIMIDRPELIEWIQIKDMGPVRVPDLPDTWILNMKLMNSALRKLFLYAPIRLHLKDGKILEINFYTPEQ